MQAVIFADRHGAELAPLCDAQCPALLSVANRPLLQYTIEDLATAGVTEILLVVSDDAAQIEAVFGDGTMWGVNIRYLLSRGEESPQRLLARFAALLKPPFLAARGDVLRSAACSELLAGAASFTAAVIGARGGGAPVALCLVRKWPAVVPQLAWPLLDDAHHSTAFVDLRHVLFAALDSLADFHQAALQLAAPRTHHPEPVGVELASGLRSGPLSQVHPQNRASGYICVGEQAWLHHTARLAGPCVVGSFCYIDRGVQISNTVVMPDSYIGENLQVENAIIAGNHLIRVDLGIELALGESKLLSSNGNEFGAALRQWPERVIGATLLLLSLPLWPLALLAASLAAPQRALTRQQIFANRECIGSDDSQPSVVTAWQFATPIPVLRRLPMLWLVARGELRLFGARPLPAKPPGVPGTTQRQRAAHKPSGLLGPAALYLSADAPDEEIDLCELEFTANTRFSSLLARLLCAIRLLFSARAWWPAQKTPGNG